MYLLCCYWLWDEIWVISHLVKNCNPDKTWTCKLLFASSGKRLSQKSLSVLSSFFLPVNKFNTLHVQHSTSFISCHSLCGRENQAQTRIILTLRKPHKLLQRMLCLIAPGQSSLFADWLCRKEPTAPHTADVFIGGERDRKRDQERGRKKDVASASRLRSNWFVVFSKHVWVWLMYIRTRADRKHPGSQTCFYSTAVFRFFEGILTLL